MNKPEFPQAEGQDQSSENNFEKSPQTVKELLAQWVEESETTEDQDLQKELSYKILKMTIALRQANLDPEKVVIVDFKNDELANFGTYDADSRQISIGGGTLELPAGHFTDVTFHEATHAGKTTHGRRIFDEGMTEWFTRYKLPNALGGFYTKEQGKAKKAFGSETGSMLEAAERYDYDHPTELAKWYLEVELDDLLHNADPDQAETLVRAHLKNIEKVFKEAVPDLYHHLKQMDFKFDQEAEKIIAKKFRAAA